MREKLGAPQLILSNRPIAREVAAMIFQKLLKMIQPSKMRLSVRICPACGLSPFVQLGLGEVAVRCLRCTATPVHLALIAAVKASLPHLQRWSAYELSSSGPVLAYLRTRFDEVTCSEYFKDIPGGTFINGVRCEDVQKLSFKNESFDLCTSTEVFEHVPDDMAGFNELFRVLRPRGRLIFTVPLTNAQSTTERAAMVDGKLAHFHAPTYHGDRLTGSGSVLVFRDYGADICARLKAVGFTYASIAEPTESYFGYSRKVVVAVK